MSSNGIRQGVLRTTRDGFRALTSPSARQTSPCFGSIFASRLSAMSRSGATPLQTRYFHPTLAGRLFESPESGPSIVPPIPWLQDADEETLQDVQKTVAASFAMASKSPIQYRDQAYREASFQVPREIARLNPGAPRFKVENMGSLSVVANMTKALEESGVHQKPPIDIQRDARVFLYFPNNSAKATAAFLAINAQFSPREERFTLNRTGNQELLWQTALNIWLRQNMQWATLNPDILDRIGPERLPVIITFREEACGAIWDSNLATFLNTTGLQFGVTLIPKDQ